MRTRFGEFVLDSDARLLERAGEPVHLTAKALALLEILLAERPRAVSKLELLDRVWSDVVVAAENVKNLIAEIRSVLDDGHRYIRTVHHFGYAFAGDAQEEGTEPVQAQAWLYYEAKPLPITASETYVGRDQECAICIDAPGVSRRHARIVINADGALLEDLGSKNGTHVGRMRVREPVRLQDGDRIRLGSVKLTFRSRSTSGSTLTEGSQGS
jgi:DNA-binding winged helix-turn-helix (wHTH) protein